MRGAVELTPIDSFRVLASGRFNTANFNGEFPCERRDVQIPVAHELLPAVGARTPPQQPMRNTFTREPDSYAHYNVILAERRRQGECPKRTKILSRCLHP
jgi:hypothetical protein